MTLFIDFRSEASRGVVMPAKFGETAAGNLNATEHTPIDAAIVRGRAQSKHVLFVCHGFNVNRAKGITSAVRMEAHLQLKTAPYPIDPGTTLFVGVLWPGDWYNVLNFPTEARDAISTGNYLATAIRNTFDLAASISFASHSLGARVILTAAAGISPRKADQIILTAPAADNNTLVKQHVAARNNANAVHVLSSKRDRTLKYVYPAGDAISDILGDDDSPFNAALGYRGPKPAVMDRVVPFGIPGKPHNGGPQNPALLSDYDHCDYFPPFSNDSDAKSRTVSNYIAAAFSGKGTRWP